MIHKSPHFHTAGQQYRHFKVTKITDIPELNCQLIELIHLPTCAKIMHIANDDPENLFCLSFQTIPSSSNGVAHILEHTVLCGSKKFPVKDPFFAMQRRSLNTFMNALTGADFTCYPAASQVPKDFYNLLEVYIDAVFHPNLNELSFKQEGHRLEFALPTDSSSPLEYKGIVFNEMKGALTSPSARLHEILSQALFPDLTYGVNSGGDPHDIPKLTYQELCEFHRTYYHPSHCLFFFYGSLPLEDHLDFISAHILDEATPVSPLPALPMQPRFKTPRRLTKGYPIAKDEETEDKTQIAFGWLTCHILEQEELLALNILEIILMDTDASPLKMTLLKSGLCKQASCYMDDEISEVPFIIILKGCNADHSEALEKLIHTTLTDLFYQGISIDLIENAIHQLEFHRSEIIGDHVPFGLSLFMRSALLQQHGGNPEHGLKIHSLFENMRRRNLEDPSYFVNLLKKHLIDNPHFVRVTLVPDKELAAQEHEQEKAALQAIQAKLSKQERQKIVQQALELEAFQQKQAEENIDILPKVSLKDVPHAVRTFDLGHQKMGNLELFHHHCFTNGIVYTDLVFDLPAIDEEDLPYVRLFATLLSQMGCNGRDYAKNLEFIQANTGGIHASLTFNLQANNHSSFSPSLYLRGKALHRKAHNLFTLLGDMATSVDFTDHGRLKEVIHKQFTAMQSNFSQSALKYAINLSASGLDVPSKIANLWYGLDYFWAIKELAQDFHNRADWLIDKLQTLQQKLLLTSNPHLIITSDAATFDEIHDHGFYGLTKLDSNPSTKWHGHYPLTPSYTHARIIASPIAFTGQVMETVSYIHPDAAPLNVASFLFDNLTLHTSLREKGGAYGGGAVSNAMSGTLYFYAYRDPNILTSLEAFHQCVQEVLQGNFDDSDLEEAKLEMVQSMDSPVAPGNRGELAYSWLREGKTTEMRQAFRDRMLSLTQKDVIHAVQKHVLPKMDSAATVVFAGKELLEKENAKLIAQGLPPFPIEPI